MLLQYLLEKIRPGDYEVPSCIQKNCRRFYILGGALAFAGAALSLVQKDIASLVITILIGVIISSIGYIRYVKVSRKGYMIIEGECYMIEYRLTTRVKKDLNIGGIQIPFRFLIKSPNEETGKADVYQIFYFRSYQQLQEGDKVRIYYDKDAVFSDLNGVLGGSDVLGYELVS